ncbi:MAG: hypothetical protein WA645_18690, partial [Pseudolabrys sp.]
MMYLPPPSMRTLRTARIIHVAGNLLRAFGGKFIEPICPALNQGKLTLFFSLARLRQRQPIVFPLPFEFYLQKISINRLYAVIPFHSLGLS